MKFPSSIQCMDYDIFEKKKKRKLRKHKLPVIQNKYLFVGTEIFVTLANEYDREMFMYMCKQMYSQMYLTT